MVATKSETNETSSTNSASESAVILNTDVKTKVAQSGTPMESENVKSSDVAGGKPSATKAQQNETYIEKIARLEAKLCYYIMEVEELGSPLGRLRTIRAYFDIMVHSWGIDQDVARRSLEQELLRQGWSQRTILRILPVERKDPTKRTNRLGKIKQATTGPVVAEPTETQEGATGCCQDPD